MLAARSISLTASPVLRVHPASGRSSHAAYSGSHLRASLYPHCLNQPRMSASVTSPMACAIALFNSSPVRAFTRRR